MIFAQQMLYTLHLIHIFFEKIHNKQKYTVKNAIY